MWQLIDRLRRWQEMKRCQEQLEMRFIRIQIQITYHVVNAKGELAGAFAFGGADVQAELLREDGVEVVDGKVDLTKYQMDDQMEE